MDLVSSFILSSQLLFVSPFTSSTTTRESYGYYVEVRLVHVDKLVHDGKILDINLLMHQLIWRHIRILIIDLYCVFDRFIIFGDGIHSSVKQTARINLTTSSRQPLREQLHWSHPPSMDDDKLVHGWSVNYLQLLTTDHPCKSFPLINCSVTS